MKESNNCSFPRSGLYFSEYNLIQVGVIEDEEADNH